MHFRRREYEKVHFFCFAFCLSYDKVKLLLQSKRPTIKQNAKGSMYSGNPTIQNDAPINHPSSIQVVPKLYCMFIEKQKIMFRINKNANFSFDANGQQTDLNANEEEKESEDQDTHIIYVNFMFTATLTIKSYCYLL